MTRTLSPTHRGADERLFGNAGTRRRALRRGAEINEPAPTPSLRAQRSNPGAASRGPWVASSQELLAMTGGGASPIDSVIIGPRFRSGGPSLPIIAKGRLRFEPSSRRQRNFAPCNSLKKLKTAKESRFTSD